MSDPVSLTPMGEAVLKSHSLPPSVISSARGKIRLTRQNDKLVAKGLQTDIRVHPDKIIICDKFNVKFVGNNTYFYCFIRWIIYLRNLKVGVKVGATMFL